MIKGNLINIKLAAYAICGKKKEIYCFSPECNTGTENVNLFLIRSLGLEVRKCFSEPWCSYICNKRTANFVVKLPM